MKPVLAAAAVALALGSPAGAFDLTEMTPAEREAFRAEVRAYLLEHPEVLMEAIGALENRQAAEQAQTDQDLIAVNADEIFEDGRSWVGGNPDGDIVFVEFMDYRCGYCIKAADEVKELVKDDGNIRFIVKEFPILGEQSVLASRFAIATRNIEGPEAYSQVHDGLLHLRGEINETSLARLASEFELDFDAIGAEMQSEAVNAEISANHELAQRLQINGTPTFVLDGAFIRGYAPLDAMKDIVREARAD